MAQQPKTTSGSMPPQDSFTKGPFAEQQTPLPADTVVPRRMATDNGRGQGMRVWFGLRREISQGARLALGLVCVVLIYGLWWFLTRDASGAAEAGAEWGGAPEGRILAPTVLPSPEETFSTFRSLWFDRELTRNTLASLRRVGLGFGLAALVGIPIGVLCGCFPWFNAFLAPVTIFGRNIPVAALIPLTFSFFGIGETQKIMFIFIASVAFVVIDTARAVSDVSSRYIDTAYTLGASRRQIILKVLVPLAFPGIFNSLRLLFGLAFGYIMLAEVIKIGNVSGGLGDIINTSQKRGPREHIYLVLLIIPLVALAIDRGLYWIQRQLFPYQYGGPGYLKSVVRLAIHAWEDFKGLIVSPKTLTPIGSPPNR